MCVFLFAAQRHRNSQWVDSNLELLVGLALPHVMEQVPAGLADTSCRRQHRLPRLQEERRNTAVRVESHTHTFKILSLNTLIVMSDIDFIFFFYQYQISQYFF